MKKLIFVMLSIMIIFTGCNKESSLYGKVENNKYINDKYNFSMDIPKNWRANPDGENTNTVNGKRLNDKESENLDRCFIRVMYPIKTKGVRKDANRDLSAEEWIAIFFEKTPDGFDKYIDEEYNFAKDNFIHSNVKQYRKKVNGKEFEVIDIDNIIIYIYKMDEKRALVFNGIYFDESKENVLKSMESIKIN